MVTDHHSNLDTFRTAKPLRWQPLTEFEPGTGADGMLTTDDGYGLPLQIIPEQMIRDDVHPPFWRGVGIVVAAPQTVDAVQAAVRGWCRDHLGRDDLIFDPWPAR